MSLGAAKEISKVNTADLGLGPVRLTDGLTYETENKNTVLQTQESQVWPAPQTKLKWDREYDRWRKPLGSKWRLPVFATALGYREYYDPMMRSIWAKIPTAQPAVTQTVHTATSYDGAEIQIIRFTTSAHLQKRKSSRRSEDVGEEDSKEKKKLSPAWLYFHGGAMIAGEVIPAQVSKLVADSGVQAFGVVYRMPPEDPAPTPVEDCYAALKWVHSHALDLGIDPARLGLMGDSAGGGLATGTALMARDRGLDPPVARQLLIYPMLDDRTIMNMSPDGPLAGFASLPLEDIVLGWEAYLGKENAGKARAEVTAYAAPGRAKDLRGMPATYMDVGNLDLFRDECSLFAARLAAADVDVEFHMFSGVPHGFESAWSIAITARALAGRMSFMTSL